MVRWLALRAPEESPEEFQVTEAVCFLNTKAFTHHSGLWGDSWPIPPFSLLKKWSIIPVWIVTRLRLEATLPERFTFHPRLPSWHEWHGWKVECGESGLAFTPPAAAPLGSEETMTVGVEYLRRPSERRCIMTRKMPLWLTHNGAILHPSCPGMPVNGLPLQVRHSKVVVLLFKVKGEFDI